MLTSFASLIPVMNPKEKLLLAVLALILLALFYYQFVDKTVREAIVNAESDAQMYQTELTAAEKRIIELYRKADADTKKEVEALLKGEKEDGDLVGTLLGGAMELFGNLGK